MFRVDIPYSEKVVIDGTAYPLSFAPHGVVASPDRPAAHHWIYVIKARMLFAEHSKVGISASPDGRLAELQPASPVPLELIKTWAVPKCASKWIEDRSHEVLRASHLHNEWFKVSPAAAVAAVTEALGDLGLYMAFYELALHRRPEWVAAAKKFKNRPKPKPAAPAPAPIPSNVVAFRR